MIELVLAAALLLSDPPGDAVGAGGLVPPSAEQYRNVGSFDLLEVEVLDSSMLALTIEMAALPNPAGLPNGFSNAVIDVYIDLGEGGAEALLPGPEMRMPPGRGWEVALRITGDGATAYLSNDDPTAGGPSVSYPVQVQAEDRVIRVETPFERTEVEGVYALTGVYDPFVASGWRPFAETASPWAFASEEQRRPVIDLLAPDEVAQAEAIRAGVLPTPRNRTAGAMWMLLMAVGVLVAGVGLVLRRMVRPEVATAGAPTAGSPVGAAEGGGPVPPSEPDEGASVEPPPGETAPAAAVTLPKFLPALPPPKADVASIDRPAHPPSGSHASSEKPKRADRERAQRAESAATRATLTETFGTPGSWLDDPGEDPEARTWRGDAPGADETEPERAEEPTESASSRAVATPEVPESPDAEPETKT